MNKETQKIIDKLKNRYKDDTEALAEIERRITDINYIEKKEKAGEYKGQSSLGVAKSLETHLKEWY